VKEDVWTVDVVKRLRKDIKDGRRGIKDRRKAGRQTGGVSRKDINDGRVARQAGRKTWTVSTVLAPCAWPPKVYI
jgi:hypothetical protein